jgi:hypothetical protein
MLDDAYSKLSTYTCAERESALVLYFSMGLFPSLTVIVCCTARIWLVVGCFVNLAHVLDEVPKELERR